MTVEERIIHEVQRALGAKFVIDKIKQNWKPHIYIVSKKATDWLTKHCHGNATADNVGTVERVTEQYCQEKDCGKRLSEHTVTNIICIHLRISIGYQYANERLKAMEAVLKVNGIDGYELTEGKYKILPRKVKSK